MSHLSIVRDTPGGPDLIGPDTHTYPDAITAVENARQAAMAPDYDGDRADTVALARQRLADGHPLDAVILDAWRAGAVTGHLDGAASMELALRQARLNLATLEAVHAAGKR
jgi:hypothetical protein